MIVFIIFFGLLILTYFAVQIRNKYNFKVSETCNNDSECPSGTTCQVNPEYGGKKQCLDSNKKFCSVTPATEMVKCVLGSNQCDVCLNNPKFTCVPVTESSPYTWKVKDICTPGGRCTNFEGNCIQEGNTTFCQITAPTTDPGFGWCLPNVVGRDVVCNEYTSDYVLEEVDAETSTYKWSCRCKYPELFDHGSGAGSNCTAVKACGANMIGGGELYVPKPDVNGDIVCNSNTPCPSGSICLKKTNSPNEPCLDRVIDGGSTSGVCHIKWEPNSGINPLGGRCKCGDNQAYQCVKLGGEKYQMSCATTNNTCYPQQTTSTGCTTGKSYTDRDGNKSCCVCPTTAIRCPDDIPETSGLHKYCLDNGPICIPDPCASATIPDGHWDAVQGKCICTTTNPYGREIADETSPVGRTCKDMCFGGGECKDRGTCFVLPEKNVSQCCGCIRSHTNSDDITCTCSSSREYKDKFEKSTDASRPCDGTLPTDNPKNYQYWTGLSSDRLNKRGDCVKYLGDGCPHDMAVRLGLWANEPNVCVRENTQDLVSCGGTGTDRGYCPALHSCVGTGSTAKCCPGVGSVGCSNGKCCPKDYPSCDVANNKCKNTALGTEITMGSTAIPQ